MTTNQARQPHIVYFRHGAVVLQLRFRTHEDDRVKLAAERIFQSDARARPAMDDETCRAVAAWLRLVGVPLYGDSGDIERDRDNFSLPFQEAGGKPRSVVPLRATMMQGGDRSVLFTVNLANWIKDPVNERDQGALQTAIADVAVAVRNINNWIADERRMGAERRERGERGENLDGLIPGTMWIAESAGPVWFGVAFNGDGCGGPGGRPIAARPGGEDNSFRHFHRDDIDAAVDRAVNGLGRPLPPPPALTDPPPRPGEGIAVAIIDTWPVGRNEFSEIVRKRDQLLADHRDASRHDAFSRLGIIQSFDDLVAGRDVEQMPSTKRGYLDLPEDYFTIADHGLFIADIINDIAPGTEIRVYRALNDFGITDLELVGKAIDYAIQDAGGKPLIINCSLGFAPELILIEPLLRRSPVNPFSAASAYGQGRDFFQSIGPALSIEPSKNAILGTLDLPDIAALRTMFALPLNGQVLTVAAAGNDSRRGDDIVVAPRVPAAIEEVLGVSAIVPDAGPTNWRSAPYTNDDDVENERDDGVSAMGGDATMTAFPVMSLNGLVGLYVTDNIPNNDWGRAEWSGTSFATPIITGLAACVWWELLRRGANPVPDAQLVMAAIVGPPLPSGGASTPGSRLHPSPGNELRRIIPLRQLL
jgi:hypothetical protein